MKSCLQVRALLECKSARALTPGDLWYPLICSCKSCDSPACAAKCWDRFFPRNSAVGGSAFPHINRTSLPLPPFPRRLVHTLLPDRDKSEPKSPDPSPFSRQFPRSRRCCSHRILFLFVALDFKEWLIEGPGGIGEYQSKLFKPHNRDPRSPFCGRTLCLAKTRPSLAPICTTRQVQRELNFLSGWSGVGETLTMGFRHDRPGAPTENLLGRHSAEIVAAFWGTIAGFGDTFANQYFNLGS